MWIKFSFLWICIFVSLHVIAQHGCDTLPIPFNTKVQKHMYRQAFKLPLSKDSIFSLTHELLWHKHGTSQEGKPYKKSTWYFHRSVNREKGTIIQTTNRGFIFDSVTIRSSWQFMVFDSLLVCVVLDFSPYYSPPEGATMLWYKANSPKYIPWQHFIQQGKYCNTLREFDAFTRRELKYLAYYLADRKVAVEEEIKFSIME